MRAARILVLAAVAGCWSSSSQTPATTDPKPADPPQDPAIAMVTSVVVIDACPDSKRIDSKAASREIEELVGPCKTVPGGAAHFSAILLPGGQVELASPSGDPSEGVVPTCLLQQQKQLKHKIKLTKACKFDVKLEQRLATQP